MAETSPRPAPMLGGVYPITTGETVYLVFHRNRHGFASYAFSTEERAQTYADQLAREIWGQRHMDDAPEDRAEFWDAFYQHFDDEEIETDSPTVDNHE